MQPFPQNIIAVIWDFDKTLIPGNMQQVIFDEYGADGATFWQEVNALPAKYRRQGYKNVTNELLYLNHILDYVRDGRFKDLSNDKLRQLGQRLEFYPGVMDFLPHLKSVVIEGYADYELKLEHYVVSTGLQKVIEGSLVAKHLDGVWGCEFLDKDLSQGGRCLDRIAYVLDDTTKTRAVFEINKGINKFPDKFQVNDAIEEGKRRVPISQMIYIADGPSDVPVFSVIKRYGGVGYAVYNSATKDSYDNNFNLREQGRVEHFGKADYRPDSDTAMWLERKVRQLADAIAKRREAQLAATFGRAPTHAPGAKDK